MNEDQSNKGSAFGRVIQTFVQNWDIRANAPGFGVFHGMTRGLSSLAVAATKGMGGDPVLDSYVTLRADDPAGKGRIFGIDIDDSDKYHRVVAQRAENARQRVNGQVSSGFASAAEAQVYSQINNQIPPQPGVAASHAQVHGQSASPRSPAATLMSHMGFKEAAGSIMDHLMHFTGSLNMAAGVGMALVGFATIASGGLALGAAVVALGAMGYVTGKGIKDDAQHNINTTHRKVNMGNT